MDMTTYFKLFWAPAMASAGLIGVLWAQGVLSGRAPLVLGCWFLVALAAQYLGTLAGAWWMAGLALQTGLAVFLLVRHQIGQP
jgi:hypothetical protein